MARNIRAAGAEIDFVAIDGETVVFIEVKTRSGVGAGEPADSVDGRKEERMRRAGEAFAVRRRVSDRAMRFELVAITLDDRR